MRRSRFVSRDFGRNGAYRFDGRYSAKGGAARIAHPTINTVGGLSGMITMAPTPQMSMKTAAALPSGQAHEAPLLSPRPLARSSKPASIQALPTPRYM